LTQQVDLLKKEGSKDQVGLNGVKSKIELQRLERDIQLLKLQYTKAAAGAKLAGVRHSLDDEFKENISPHEKVFCSTMQANKAHHFSSGSFGGSRKANNRYGSESGPVQADPCPGCSNL
jgi:hypothetical protein